MKRTPRARLLFSIVFVLALGATAPAQVNNSKKHTPANAAGGDQDSVALRSANPVERANAACRLGKQGAAAADAIPALTALFDDTTAIKAIACWANSDWSPKDEQARETTPGKEAAKAVAAMGDVAIAPLIAALADTRWAVRTNAAWAIGEIRGGHDLDRSQAITPLIAALQDGNAEVRAAAAETLGEIASPAATDGLVAALGDHNWLVRQKAAWALAEIKDGKAVDALIVALGDNRVEVRGTVADALGEIKDPRAASALRALLSDESPIVRQSAKKALSEIRDY